LAAGALPQKPSRGSSAMLDVDWYVISIL